jgi:hypothetical protein
MHWVENSRFIMRHIQDSLTCLDSLRTFIEESRGTIAAPGRHLLHVSFQRTWAELDYHWAELQRVLKATEELAGRRRDDRLLLTSSDIVISHGPLPELRQVWESLSWSYKRYFRLYEEFMACCGTKEDPMVR